MEIVLATRQQPSAFIAILFMFDATVINPNEFAAVCVRWDGGCLGAQGAVVLNRPGFAGGCLV
jgi:hypothetical protein